jgi:hypothetical protein
MKLKRLLEAITLAEKKEALSQAQALNLTIHFDSDFSEIGEEGKPQLTVTISTSSAGGKELLRTISSPEDADRVIESVKVDVRRLTRKYDQALEKIYAKYNLQIK